METLTRRLSRKFRGNLRAASVIMLIVLGCSAMMAGYFFMSDPTGAAMGLTTEALRFSPFPDFTIPGILLFIFDGMLALLCAIFLIRRLAQGPTLLLFQGVVLAVWIVVQIIMLRELNWLHVICLTAATFFIYSGSRLRFH